jgi:hypothetical protein
MSADEPIRSPAPRCEPLEARDCPAADLGGGVVGLGSGIALRPFSDWEGSLAVFDAGGRTWVGGGVGAGPRVAVLAQDGTRDRPDFFAGDPADRSGVVFVGATVPDPDPLAEGIRSVPDDVWRALSEAGHGLTIMGGKVTDHPAHAHVRGRLTADGRPYDGLAGVSDPAVVTLDAPAWVVRHEIAHDYLPLLGVPIDDEAAADRLELSWGPRR